MNTMQVAMPTAEETERLHAAVLENNLRVERTKIAADNRAKGHPEPQPGDRLYVSPGRGLKQRVRAGILFTEASPVEVTVVDEFSALGGNSVTVSGAELILADLSLNVRGRNATSAEAADLRIQVADRDREIDRLKIENARILREARMGAKDDPNGGPARLRAAKAAHKGDPDGFGGKD